MHVQGILAAKGAQVATVSPEATMGQAVELLRLHGVGALVVSTDGTTVSGIVSERDVVRLLATDGTGALDRRVADAMTIDVHTCTPADSIEALMALMTTERVRHVPVCDGGALAGIVSIGDIVKARLGQLEREHAALVDYFTNPR
jgi:CBS domain-containing protein